MPRKTPILNVRIGRPEDLRLRTKTMTKTQPAANDILGLLASLAAAQTAAAAAPPAPTAAPGEKRKRQTAEERAAAKEARRWYTDIEETRRTLGGTEPPAALLKEIEDTRNDKRLGENQRNRLLKALADEVADYADDDASAVLQQMKDERAAEIGKDQPPLRVQLTLGEQRIELRPAQLLEIVRHADALRQWAQDMKLDTLA